MEETNIPKVYDPQSFEKKWYQYWEENKLFHAEVDETKKPFSIVMPPPNVTGQLHMGHAMDNTLQDILIRFRRMQGYNTLWMPGTDHAGIATQAKVDAQLREQGVSRYDIGREKFLEHAWAWKEKYGNRIKYQIRTLGSSCDWDRERFTMDEGCSHAVREVFVQLYKKGLIYQGKRITNWCPHCNTALSDIEVEHQNEQGHLYHLKYQVEGEDRFVEIATTRPETMFGDTGVAVHPDDERYSDLVGKTLILPIVGRRISLFADSYVDPQFGTGAVKVTPAHDPNDFDMGARHNLEQIVVINNDGTMAENTGKYAGLDRYECRKQLIEDLKQQGYLISIEEHEHAVGHCSRCSTTVEPLVSKQWFVKMESLAKPAAEAVKSGKIKFVPERFSKIYCNWLDNIRDWCISRQLWWGHRIPAWYCDDCGATIVENEDVTVCPHCGSKHVHQDEDVLDTWFSSGLWPFETMGWPEQTAELKQFYPTSVLVTGYDIIFFWVIRMMFSGLEHTGKVPFDTVLIHGLVRDSQGRKMSKSLGNGIDPLEVIDKYGADALRFTLITGNAPGNDMRFYWERVEASRNFANKVWNASRFIQMNMPEEGIDVKNKPENLTDADKWILSKVNTLAKDVTENLDKFELGIAADKIYEFIWEEFCDWYIEMVKPRLYNDDDDTKKAALWTLKKVLIDALKLLHPYMPFITEEIFCNLQDEEETIMLSKWPEFTEEYDFAKEEKAVETIKEAVRNIRNIRSEMNVAPSKKAKVFVVSSEEEIKNIFENGKVFFATLGYASEVIIQDDKSGIGDDAVSVVIPKATIYMPFAELVDISKEIERLNKEVEKLNKELARVNGMLSNPNFVSKAPEKKINEEKAKQAKYQQMMDQVKEQLARLQK